jgi:hypothetical protein
MSARRQAACDVLGAPARPAWAGDRIRRKPGSVSDAGGFVIDESEVAFWGLCPTCQTTSKTKEKEIVELRVCARCVMATATVSGYDVSAPPCVERDARAPGA